MADSLEKVMEKTIDTNTNYISIHDSRLYSIIVQLAPVVLLFHYVTKINCMKIPEGTFGDFHVCVFVKEKI